MAPLDEQTAGATVRVRAIARYALMCIAIGALVAGLVVAILDDGDSDTPTTLPPVRQTQLVKAVRAGDCELRRTKDAERPGSRRAAARAAPARPQVYEDAPRREALTSALRRGVIVISYRPGLDRKRLEQLRSLQTVVPSGTIVAPDATGMRYDVAIAAYRRVLGCERFTDDAIDALRLFRGRYIGTGPDR